MKPVRFLLDVPKRAYGAPIPRVVSGGMPMQKQDGGGPELWVEEADHVVDAGARGIVIGYLFARETGHRLFRLPTNLLHDLDVVGVAAWLTRTCWGVYMALLRDGPNLQIYSDPSGLLPVFRLENEERQLCTSDLSLLRSVSLPGPQVSWSGLSAHLQRPEWRGTQTCLAGIDELAPGHLACLKNAEAKPAAVWHPSQFMPGRHTRSFDELACDLRETAQGVMRAWSGISGHVLVAASGGVDSSLIAAALATTGQHFTCLTVATTDPSGDEREPVRRLAEHLGAAMFEACYNPEQVNLLEPAALGLPRPTGKAFMQEVTRAAEQAARAFGTRVVFDGNGGDNLFCYLHSSVPILDRWWSEGLSRGTAATLLDMCRITQATIPSMVRALALRARRGSRPAAWLADRRLLSSDVGHCDVQTSLEHLALTIPREHPGKLDHLGLLLRTRNFVHPATGNADPLQFSPLLSQPLIELCLSIPTWIWCHGGINRALARAAFAKDLPSSIVRRVSKAGPDSAMREIFTHNRALIREMLLEGLLMSNGLLDAAAIERAISTGPHGDDPVIYRLLDLAEAEAWARSWQ